MNQSKKKMSLENLCYICGCTVLFFSIIAIAYITVECLVNLFKKFNILPFEIRRKEKDDKTICPYGLKEPTQCPRGFADDSFKHRQALNNFKNHQALNNFKNRQVEIECPDHIEGVDTCFNGNLFGNLKHFINKTQEDVLLDMKEELILYHLKQFSNSIVCDNGSNTKLYNNNKEEFNKLSEKILSMKVTSKTFLSFGPFLNKLILDIAQSNTFNDVEFVTNLNILQTRWINILSSK